MMMKRLAGAHARASGGCGIRQRRAVAHAPEPRCLRTRASSLNTEEQTRLVNEDGPSTSPRCESTGQPEASPLFRSVQKQKQASSGPAGDGRGEGGAGGGTLSDSAAPPDEQEIEEEGRVLGARAISVAPSCSAGRTASHLAHVLRADNRAVLTFTNSRGILKALKALAITHDFLRQHGSAASFVPVGYNVHEPPPRPANDAHDDEFDAFAGVHEQPAPQHTFTLKVWRRRCHKREVETRIGRGPPLYDFALDVRREWKSKAAVSQDMAYSLADMLYGQLVQQPEADGQELPWPSMELTPRRTYPGGVWSGPVLLSADMAQGVTLFMSLALFQQRLQRESAPLEVVVTVYRNTIAPRLDGRNGFIYKVLTRPAACNDSASVRDQWRGQPWPKARRRRGRKQPARQQDTGGPPDRHS